jgi:hypothetical protein
MSNFVKAKTFDLSVVKKEELAFEATFEVKNESNEC